MKGRQRAGCWLAPRAVTGQVHLTGHAARFCAFGVGAGRQGQPHRHRHILATLHRQYRELFPQPRSPVIDPAPARNPNDNGDAGSGRSAATHPGWSAGYCRSRARKPVVPARCRRSCRCRLSAIERASGHCTGCQASSRCWLRPADRAGLARAFAANPRRPSSPHCYPEVLTRLGKSGEAGMPLSRLARTAPISAAPLRFPRLVQENEHRRAIRHLGLRVLQVPVEESDRARGTQTTRRTQSI